MILFLLIQKDPGSIRDARSERQYQQQDQETPAANRFGFAGRQASNFLGIAVDSRAARIGFCVEIAALAVIVRAAIRLTGIIIIIFLFNANGNAIRIVLEAIRVDREFARHLVVVHYCWFGKVIWTRSLAQR